VETYENIDRELEKRGMSRRKLAISIGVPPSTFQSMMERKRGITLELLKKIADALGMSIYSLADFDLASEAVTEEINANRRESQLLSHFRTLNDNGQSVAVERVQELAQIPAYQRPAEPTQDAPGGTDDKDPAEK
jgi:transcriptional regulator with XRE-family HTH domain